MHHELMRSAIKDGQEAYFDREIKLDDVAGSEQRGVLFKMRKIIRKRCFLWVYLVLFHLVGWALALALITFPIRPVLIRASIAR
ncbi:MAG: hypothetical protein WBJ85_06805 [Acetomicrobium sp.]|jgi:hypothetical protein